MNPCLVRQVLTQPHQLCWTPAQLYQLCPYTLSSCSTATSPQTACMFPFYTKATWLNLQMTRQSSSLTTCSIVESFSHSGLFTADQLFSKQTSCLLFPQYPMVDQPPSLFACPYFKCCPKLTPHIQLLLQCATFAISLVCLPSFGCHL